MSHRSTELHTAWVLHSRPYRESSLIVDLLTVEHGVISVVVNGARGAATKKGRPRRGQLLQPFVELLVSWQGKTELKTLKTVEQRRIFPLAGIRLFSGIYANELLQRLLQSWHPIEGLPALYTWLLTQLAVSDLERSGLELCLRIFEKRLLELLGYGLPLGFDAESASAINSHIWYRYDSENGFWPMTKLAPEQVEYRSQRLFSGAMLLALASEELTAEHLPASKALMRMAIAPLLGQRPLRSRELFRGLARN